jgi:hypothetical protein
MRRIDLITIFSTFFLVILVSALSIYGWLKFVDGTYFAQPIELESSTLQTTKTEYAPGEIVQVKLKYLKNRAVMEQIQWSLVSDVLIEYAPRPVALPTGAYEFLLDVAKIPENLLDANKGKRWKFIGFMHIPINPLRTMRIPVETTQFAVTTTADK